jgi:ribonuclease T
MIETLISVDIEAAGPIPGRYSMLSIGACLIDDPEDGFYVEMQPVSDAVVPEAL